jgi:hypothetical protein
VTSTPQHAATGVPPGRHPRAGLQPGSRWPVGLALALLVLGLVGAREAHAVHTAAQLPVAPAGPVVVVGVVAHQVLTPADRAALAARPDAAQLGLVSLPASARSGCATAAWASLGTGQDEVPGGGCTPATTNGRVAGWAALARAQPGGNARLGTLAASAAGCITAVGPGAAVAAARPDGEVNRLESLADFQRSGGRTSCPLTLVDAGTDSDEVIRLLGGRTDLVVVLVGIAPGPGSDGSDLQVVYRLGARPTGWLTSRSTRRPGVVTLADLTAALGDVVRAPGAPRPAGLPGETMEVHPARTSAVSDQAYLDAVLNRPRATKVGEIVAALVAAAALGVAGLAWVGRRRTVLLRAAAVLLVLPLAMTLTGLVPWSRAGSPAAALAVALVLATAVLAETTLRVARRHDVPLAVVASAATTGVLLLDAVSGGLLQEGSLLNPRSLDGGRWYGFGNLTFAVYASAGLVLTGHVVSRLRDTPRRRLALPAGALLVAALLLSDAWPTMGADLGGVLALGPPALGLLLVLGGRALTAPRLLLLGASGVVVAAAVAVLDWLRGPAARTHLGDFVQRLLDGDAQALVVRKATAAADTVLTPWGLAALAFGVGAWTLIFMRLLEPATSRFSAIRPVAGAVLATALLGSVLNDSGLLVGAAMTTTFLVTTLTLVLDRGRPVLADGDGPAVLRP